MPAQLRLQQTLLAQALTAVLGTLAMPVFAGIVTLGAVNPDPSSGIVAGGLAIGNSATGSVRVDGGSSLRTDQLWLGTGSAAGDGTLTVTGAGSSMNVTWAGGGNLDLGQSARGAISVLNGASFVYGDSSAGCQSNCRVFISNAAGSDGNLRINGNGSSFSTLGGVVVGNASVFRIASGDTLDFGTPGASSTASARVEAGAVMSSSFLAIGQPGGGLGRTGAETSTGNVVVDGIGSVWNLVRNAAQVGGISLLRLGTGVNTSGSLDVRNGGVVKLDGSASPGEFSGINVAAIAAGSTTSNAQGNLTVNGAGSRLEANNGIGFMNVGRGNGTTGSLTVSNGGVVSGSGPEAGLLYLTVGNGGGTGSASINGNGSLLRLSGRNSATNSDPTAQLGGGAFLSLGRGGGGAAGNGTMTISNGGRMEIDTTAFALTNVNGQTGMYVGTFNGSTGTMTVTGANSTLLISSGTGMAPYVGIGRDSGTGTLTISNGGRVEVSSLHTSVPNPGASGYLPGDLNNFEVGRSITGAATSGTVSVSGAGSQLLMTGAADAFIQVGRGASGTGTLNILSGGQTRSSVVFIGTESGTGLLNMNGGQMVLDGTVNGGPGAGGGAGLGVGRGGGTGVANISGGSTISISSTSGSTASIGGSGTAPGGNGTVNLSGGSTLTVNSANALIGIGRLASASQAGVGTLTLTGAGTSAAAVGAGAQVLLASGSNTVGTAIVGTGASLSATSLIGVAHNGTASTGGIGTLVVNGTANAANLIIGTTGLLAGSGVINANVTNLGTINPGNSPGRLTINGAFDSSAGRIELEVQSLGGGQFAYDEIVFGDPSQVTMGQATIDFVFLGDTNPTDFLNAGLFDLTTFFKQVDANGAVVDLGSNYRSLFTSALFSASAAQFTVSGFAFDPLTGRTTFSSSAIPVPPSMALVLLGLMAMAGVRFRRHVH